jgi:hypothetical protein
MYMCTHSLSLTLTHTQGPCADANLCVSDAMRRDLASNWRIRSAKVCLKEPYYDVKDTY